MVLCKFKKLDLICKVLAFTDSSSALGWLFKSNFDPINNVLHDVVAQKLARDLLNYEGSLYSQHISGVRNIVADSLSRDTHIPLKKLAFILKSFFPNQAGVNFKIKTLPKEDILWLYSLKALSTATTEIPPQPTRSKVGALIDGNVSWKELVSLTNSYRTFDRQPESVSSVLSPQVLEEMNMAQETNLNFATAQSAPRLATYVRPSGRTFGTTPL